MLTCKKD